MRKLLLGFTFATVLSIVLAPLANADSIRYGYRLDNSSNTDGFYQNAFMIDYMHQTKIKNFRVGLGFRRIERDKDNRLTNRYQLRFQNRNIAGLKGLHLAYQIGTKERTGKDMTEYGQVQLQYSKRFTDSNIKWKVAYVYREGIFSGNKSTDYYQGPRLGFSYKMDNYEPSIQLDYYDQGDGKTRNRIGFRIKRNF